MSNEQSSKTNSTYYTAERVDAARENVASEAWATRMRDEAVERAEAALEDGLDGLWNRVTGQEMPRSFTPGDGTQRERWKPLPDESWALTDGEWVLPTNDFAAYRESGRDERGYFDPEVADQDLLVNQRYPEKGADWGVDDGQGWVDTDGEVGEPGTRFTPVAAYNHWHVWYDLRDDVVALRDAYLYTGEQRFARAATVVLDRLADVYPDLDISALDLDRFKNSHGGPGQGKMVGSIWETNLIRNFISAYDAVFPAQEGDDQLVAFLSAKADEYDGLGPKSSVPKIRSHIEDDVVRRVLPAVKNVQIHGNLGMHQSALAMSAVVLDEPTGYTESALEFLFQAGGLRDENDDPWDVADADIHAARERGWCVTGGNIGAALVDRLDRDGYADESAPNYNAIIQGQLLRVAKILHTYEGAEDVDLYDHPKLAKAARSHFPLLMLGKYMPSIGDSGKTGNPDPLVSPRSAIRSFEVYGDDDLGRVAHLLNGGTTDGLHGDVFSPDAGDLAAQIDEAVERDGPYDPPSLLLPSYGFAALRPNNVTSGGSKQGLWLFFGRNSIETGTSHSHRDALNLSLYGHGLSLTPDLGYPEFTEDWPKRIHWTKNTVSHNTVVVDTEPQHPVRVGTPLHFHDGDDISLVDVDAASAYPQTDTYRRATAMVSIDDTDSYVVDFFDVDGGDDHCYSLHGAEGPVTTSGLDLVSVEGTYAGPDVERPEPGEVTPYDEQVGSGFNYLTDVELETDPAGNVSVEWDVEDTWDAVPEDTDVRLRATVLSDCDEIALANGEPPTNKEGNPERLRYLLCRNRGESLNSTFTTVLEPYDGTRRVRSVASVPVRSADGSNGDRGEDRASVDARAVRVELASSRVDYVAWAPDEGAITVDCAFTFDGSFARYSTDSGEPMAATLVDGTELRSIEADETLIQRTDANRFAGTVIDFTRDLSQDNRIVVDLDVRTDVEAAIGDYLYVAGEENGVFPVEGITERAGGTLDVAVGGATTIERYVDPERPEDGFVYAVEEGARARVPNVTSWRPD